MHPLQALEMFYCASKNKKVARLNCINCQTYGRCNQLDSTARNFLETSPFVDVDKGSALVPRRLKMYLFLGYDGQLVPAYDGFDVNNPDWAKLQNVQEVLYVGKAYEKQMKLVVKNKEERIAIAKSMQSNPDEHQQPLKRRGRKKRS